ncbi:MULTISPECIES: GntR family transcriptional regulator [Methylobacterium]|jgi:DNA-binding GntR family transcriptional regulator|uniref:GntR family transcriptional regulator n=1 Tax=Methylobacterium TaxID=407 RepID=UPI0008F2E889|nr:MULTISPECIES: GntR family transcriptional regulator [Methylobacterium]MBZ6411685.1 GntR family transcriptional regulator [Methylobacterium sp.]MBK3400295.1 GntR family transcriptional regulator [Methylobacterium ajmalii]MBK3411849.1 GntR family transcriptional regulator [Methylobacterium ajmalii]MBK3423177.1 GntR family transcriptional regulator [Methylobacterium ajmalii]SFE43260.1 DNA-binding transcriptional regulator, GntR family [Methylobacterium sp. yr596]
MNAVFAGAQRLRDRSRHAAPQVFDLIRDKIVSLDLAPGTVLSRPELQASFGLSATPIRDALLRLQEEGLVDIFPQSSTVVSRIDLAAARQAQFLRRAVEQEVVRTLARAPDRALVVRLQAFVAEQALFAEAGDFARLSASDEAFHRALCEAAAVPDLWDLIRRRSGHIDRLRRLHLPVEGKAQQIVADHQRIVAALAEGEPEAAQEALRDHLSKSIALGDEIRARWPAYFA